MPTSDKAQAGRIQDSLQLVQVKSEIESIGGVFEVSYMDNIISDINKNTTKIGSYCLGF